MTALTPERFAAVKSCFAVVSELPSAVRAERLLELTSDGEVIAEALALCDAGTGTTRLSSSIGAALASAANRPPEPGDTLGVWRIERELGQGGMGSVFLAQRNDGHFQQRAAVKFLRGIPQAETLALFTRERQLLATLTHPNIARLLDGGATSQGQPYLVMEYVKGAHIDEHCRRGRLGVRAVLVLFLTACNAVASAHRQLVIHCDLKPSNLLVDGHGRPVLLDFGIARLADRVGADTPSPAYTPRYASPEQRARGVVSTASDIYSLGVLLSELLEEASDRHRVSALRLRELAAIVERAAHQDPAERYATVDALTADIRSFLDQRPIQALLGMPGYRLRRELARRRPVLAAAAVFTLTVAAFTTKVVIESRHAQAAEQAALQERDRAQEAERNAVRDRDATRQAQSAALRERDRSRLAERRAVQERDRATRAEASSRQVSDFLISIFGESNPSWAVTEIPMSKLVAQAEARVEKELAGQPTTRSDIYRALAGVQAHIGNREKALAHYQSAIEIERRQRRPLVLGRLLVTRAILVRSMFSNLKAEPDARAGLALLERHAGAQAEETISARELLGGILSELGRDQEAQPLLLQSVEDCERKCGKELLGETLAELGEHYSRRGLHDQAIKALRRSLDIRKSLADGSKDRDTIERLALVLIRAQRFEEAEPALRRAIEIERTYGNAPRIAWVIGQLARALEGAGRAREALPFYGEALAMTAKAYGEDSVAYAVTLNNRAFAAEQVGDLAAAERDFTQMLAVLENHWDDNSVSSFRLNAAWFLVRIGKLDTSKTLIMAVLNEQIASLGMKHRWVAVTRTILAQWYVKAGEAEKAREQLDLARSSSELNTEQKARIERQDALVHALEGRTEEALRDLEHAENLDRQVWGEHDSRYLLGKLDRAELLARGTADQKAASAALAAEILHGVEPLLVPDAPVLERLKKLL